MDELENKNTQEFDLEDILREFGDEQEETPTQSGVEAILREFADDPDAVVHIEDDPAPAVSSASAAAVSSTAVRNLRNTFFTRDSSCKLRDCKKLGIRVCTISV